jgi:hypothetical protein
MHCEAPSHPGAGAFRRQCHINGVDAKGQRDCNPADDCGAIVRAIAQADDDALNGCMSLRRKRPQAAFQFVCLVLGWDGGPDGWRGLPLRVQPESPGILFASMQLDPASLLHSIERT